MSDKYISDDMAYCNMWTIVLLTKMEYYNRQTI